MVDGYDIMGNADQTVGAIEAFLADLPSSEEGRNAQPTVLTRRQIEVLRMVAEGKTNREIADALVLSVRTVERHLSDAYAKLGARNRFEAIAKSRSF